MPGHNFTDEQLIDLSGIMSFQAVELDDGLSD